MADLVACLSTGKGTWGHVARLITDGEWDRIYLITNEFGKENFTPEKGAELIVVDSRKSIVEVRDEIISNLKDKLSGTEVAVNIVSGTGKEHMAIISAILKIGMGIRFVALTKDGVQEV